MSAKRQPPATAFPAAVTPRVWRITLPFLPLSVNRLYRPTEDTGRRVLTEEAKQERHDIAMIAALSGFCTEDGVLYGVRATFTMPNTRGDLDNFFKQLLDSVFGKEADRRIVRLEADKRIERGIRQTDITIYEVTTPDAHAPALSAAEAALASGQRMIPYRRTERGQA